ncbi:MAG: helix-turn-helix domain-containing protein [Bacillota bacterium]
MIGSRIKEHREKIGLSQVKLAERLSVTQQTVGSWETGKNRPDAATVYALATIFGIPAEELQYGKTGASIQRLTLARKLVGIADLARASGVTTSLAEQYALGLALPSKEDERKLCDTLKVTRDELYGVQPRLAVLVDIPDMPFGLHKVGVRIRELRENAGQDSAAKMADFLGLSVETIEAIEFKGRSPDEKLIRLLAEKYECPIEYITGEKIYAEFAKKLSDILPEGFGDNIDTKAFGVEKKEYLKWKSGISVPDNTTLIKLGEYLKVSVSDFRADNKKKPTELADLLADPEATWCGELLTEKEKNAIQSIMALRETQPIQKSRAA